MSVDALRENFHVNRIASYELQDFLTAQTYRPDITLAYQKIYSLPYSKLQDLCDKRIQQGSTPIYAPLGHICLKSKHVEEILVNEVDETFVDDIWAKNNQKNKVTKEDILLTRQGVGTIGRAGIYFGTSAYTNDSLFKITVDTADSAFVCVFLNTSIGQRLIEKGVYGSTGQLNLSVEHVKMLPIPIFNAFAQKYIGDKIRKAEKLIVWAKTQENNFQKKLKSTYPDVFVEEKVEGKFSRAPSGDISYTLNPGAFDKERLRIRSYLKECSAIKLKEIASIEGPTVSSYSSGAKYIGLDTISSTSCALSPSTVEESKVKGTCRLLAEGPVVAKLRPYLNKVTYIPKALSGAIGSTELLCVRPKPNYSGWYVYGILKSDIGLRQLKPLATGSTHPRIDKHDLYDLFIPFHHEGDKMGMWLKDAQTAYFIASDLISCAKALVESLIEGQLTEEQLIRAQQALDDGDTTLDRDILSKLSNEGYAVEGATQLFSDIDELYRLLESANETEEEE